MALPPVIGSSKSQLTVWTPTSPTIQAEFEGIGVGVVGIPFPTQVFSDVGVSVD